MKILKNILLLLIVFVLSFGTASAQKNKRKKQTVSAKKKVTTSNRKLAISNQQPSTTYQLSTSRTDTAAPKEVTITSSFKPSLRNAAKINFTAATPVLDTSKLPLTYNIPSSNLFFSYQPVAIKPVALFIDTAIKWDNNAYVKAGFGNFSSPYAEAGMAFGDGKKTIFSLHGKHTSSKGKLPFQQFSKTGVDFLGNITSPGNNEITTKLYFDNSVQYQYGFNPTALALINYSNLKQAFNTVGIDLGLENKAPNTFGITYHPQIKASSFFDNKSGNEINLMAKLPINKTFGRLFAFDLSGTADITSFKTQLVPNTTTIKNNLFYIDPSIQFKTPNVKLNIGIQPSWDNQNFSILPNLTAEAKLNEEKLKQISKVTNGIYIRLQSSDDAVSQLKGQLSQIDRKAFSDMSMMSFRNYFLWFAAAMFILLFIEPFISERKKNVT